MVDLTKISLFLYFNPFKYLGGVLVWDSEKLFYDYYIIRL